MSFDGPMKKTFFRFHCLASQLPRLAAKRRLPEEELLYLYSRYKLVMEGPARKAGEPSLLAGWGSS